MKKNLLLYILILITQLSCGQQQKRIDDSKYIDTKSIELVNSFFGKVKSGNYANALDELLGQNTNIDLKDSLTLSLKNKFSNINEYSGKFISYRLLLKKSLSNDLGVYSYIVKYDKKFYRFLFTFYNNESSVNIYKFSFDDTLDFEIEESLRLYLNNENYSVRQ
jgi:hypothetical protein